MCRSDGVLLSAEVTLYLLPQGQLQDVSTEGRQASWVVSWVLQLVGVVCVRRVGNLLGWKEWFVWGVLLPMD